ncbi:MAG: archease [Candidatus Aenigmatarchaeota archaeon]
MERFKFIDITTADVAFEAYGKDLNELFANSALATFEVMINTSLVDKKIERFIEVNGYDLLSLMFNWLNELIFYVDAENLAFSEFEVNVDEKNFKLKAICRGEKIDRNKHEVRTLVKACTYHNMKIWKENEVWKAIVILDI